MSTPSARAVTAPPRSHFFGYFDRSAWDGSDDYLLTHSVGFDDRMPTPGEAAQIRRIDPAAEETELVGETTAWNWQKGSLLQWVPPDFDRIAFHDYGGDSFVTRVVDPETGTTETLPRPVNAISNDGELGFSLNVVRLTQTRPVCGYALPEPPTGTLERAPDDDGLFVVDMASGDSELLLSYAEAAADNPIESVGDETHWFNHYREAPSGHRICITQRYKPMDGDRPRKDRLLVVDGDTGECTTVTGGDRVGHPVWLSDTEIVARTEEASHGLGWYRYDLETGSTSPFAPRKIEGRGHLSFSPDGEWGAIDTYPDDDRLIHLRLYHLETDRLIEIGAYHAPPVEDRLWRCDLHPRWNREGTALCFDARHEGSRQLYVLDVSGYVD